MDLYANVVRRMDLAFENYLAQDNSLIEPDDIPKTNSPVWILGRRYNAIQGNFNKLIVMCSTVRSIPNHNN